MNQPMIPDIARVDSTGQRTPLVLVLDCSGSLLVPLAIDGLSFSKTQARARLTLRSQDKPVPEDVPKATLEY